MSTSAELASWVDLVHDLLEDRPSAEGVTAVASRLLETFDNAVCYSQLRADRSLSITFPDRDATWVPSDFEDRWFRPVVRHPIAVWLLASCDPTATTVGRIPEQVVPQRLKQEMYEYLRPYGVEHQLTIPCVVSPTDHVSYF